MSIAVIFDIDGTLVDTTYQHALAWYRAFREHKIVLPVWRLHRAIGIGSDRLVDLVAGAEVEAGLGDELRDTQSRIYHSMIGEVEPTPGAHALLDDLKSAGHRIILASSASEDETEHYMDLLDARHLIDGYTTSADVDESKPEADIVESAVSKAGGGPALMVGDSTWDAEAASRAGVTSIAVLTGGFGEQELKEAGATIVVETVEDLRLKLSDLRIEDLASRT